MYKITIFIVLLFIMIMPVAAQTDTAPYQDPARPVVDRVNDLLGRMTLEEKIGQMTLIEKNSIVPADVTRYHIGGVLSGGGGYPNGDNTPDGWREMVRGYQDAALDTRLGIPVIYGATIFPHNIGLGASRNPELVREIGRLTAREMTDTGIYWNFSPVLAVPRDIRWGRTYEGYSENTDLVTRLSTALLQGLQGADLGAADTVLGTPKHFVADGGTTFGTSPIACAVLDRGDAFIDEETLRVVHLPPYINAVDNGARSIMISFSSWRRTPMHANTYLMQDVLRGELGFDGFVVSDWEGVSLVSDDPYEAVVQSINAGIDMNMVPYDYRGFTSTLARAVENGDVSMARIDEAVSNILRVKFELGLFERPYSDPPAQNRIGATEHRAVARDAVSQSLVLLKNQDAALPLDGNARQRIFLAGEAADNIGLQSGGWTIEWQGAADANLTEGTTLREALMDAVGDDVTLDYHANAQFEAERADVGIVVVGEQPYTEWEGDVRDLSLSAMDKTRVDAVRGRVDTLIVVLVSGRPMVVTDTLNQADAFVVAWLPGTEGAGVTDVLLGQRDFVGQLPYTWPRDNNQLPFNFEALSTTGCNAPLFPYGYGLTYTGERENLWLDLAATCAGTS